MNLIVGLVVTRPSGKRQTWVHSPRPGFILPDLGSFPQTWVHSLRPGFIPSDLGSFPQMWVHYLRPGFILPDLGSFSQTWVHSLRPGFIVLVHFPRPGFIVLVHCPRPGFIPPDLGPLPAVPMDRPPGGVIPVTSTLLLYCLHCLVLRGHRWDGLARCQHTVTG